MAGVLAIPAGFLLVVPPLRLGRRLLQLVLIITTTKLEAVLSIPAIQPVHPAPRRLGAYWPVRVLLPET